MSPRASPHSSIPHLFQKRLAVKKTQVGYAPHPSEGLIGCAMYVGTRHIPKAPVLKFRDMITYTQIRECCSHLQHSRFLALRLFLF